LASSCHQGVAYRFTAIQAIQACNLIGILLWN